MPIFVKIINPKINDGIEFKEDENYDGHDGALNYEYSFHIEHIVVFSPSQIKSATSNTGSFSNETGDIRFKFDPNTINDDVREMRILSVNCAIYPVLYQNHSSNGKNSLSFIL